jgi:hypothetical protein
MDWQPNKEISMAATIVMIIGFMSNLIVDSLFRDNITTMGKEINAGPECLGQSSPSPAGEDGKKEGA